MSMGDTDIEKRSSTTAQPYINVTPLIDVLLVLLIIFMVVTPLKPSRFKADIPTQRDPNEDLSKLKPNPLTLVVSIAPDLSDQVESGCHGFGERHHAAGTEIGPGISKSAKRRVPIKWAWKRALMSRKTSGLRRRSS